MVSNKNPQWLRSHLSAQMKLCPLFYFVFPAESPLPGSLSAEADRTLGKPSFGPCSLQPKVLFRFLSACLTPKRCSEEGATLGKSVNYHPKG